VSRKQVLVGLLTVLVVGTTGSVADVAWAETGGLRVVAGTGAAGSSGDGGPAIQALLRNPGGVAVAGDGTVYISDTGNHTVRAVSPAGTIGTVAGTGRLNSAAANSGPVDPADTAVPTGTKGTAFNLAAPAGLAVGPDRTLYIADTGLRRVFALTADGGLSVLAGTGAGGFSGDGGAATGAAIGLPGGLAAAADGTVYLCDVDHHRVRAVARDGVITTVAGNGGDQLTAAGGPAKRIPVGAPQRLAVDGHGVVWIVSELTLLRLDGDQLATVTGSGASTGETWGLASTGAPVASSRNSLVAVAASGETVYALDGQDQTIRRLRAGHTMDTVPTDTHSITGPIAVSAAGVVYLVDTSNSRVYSLRMPAERPTDADPTSPVPWWPFAAAGAVLLVIGAWLLIRRRSHR
jgi:sugar lactone lactonase YvrE